MVVFFIIFFPLESFSNATYTYDNTQPFRQLFARVNSYNLGRLNYTENLFYMNNVELNFAQKSSKIQFLHLSILGQRFKPKPCGLKLWKNQSNFSVGVRKDRGEGTRLRISFFRLFPSDSGVGFMHQEETEEL